MPTKVQFTYGAMNSGKSLELIKVAYNYKENNISCLILKPEIDTRAKSKVVSRTNLSIDAVETPENDPEKLLKLLETEIGDSKVIMIDEANFYNEREIDVIIDFAYDKELSSVLFFGLKSDFKGNLFEGSKRIIERADKIEESTSICWCGKKARQTARIVNGKVTKEGPIILVEDENTVVNYTSLCNYHHHKGELSE